MNRGLRFAFVCLLIGCALEMLPAAAEEPTLQTRVVTIRYRSLDDAVLLVRPLLGDYGSVEMRPHLRTLAITDEPSHLDAAARALAAFDVPPRRVNLAVSLIMGSRGGDDGEQVPRQHRAVPRLPGFDSTLKALEHTVWTDYRLIGSASFTAAEGEESELSLGEEFRIRLRVNSVDPVARLTRFDRFSLERQSGDVAEFKPIWNHILNLRDDQLYVFGATRMEDSERAIFLSVTAGIEQ